MDAQTHAELKAHVKALAEILRRETNPETIKTFKSIEYAVWDLGREDVLPLTGQIVGIMFARGIKFGSNGRNVTELPDLQCWADVHVFMIRC